MSQCGHKCSLEAGIVASETRSSRFHPQVVEESIGAHNIVRDERASREIFDNVLGQLGCQGTVANPTTGHQECPLTTAFNIGLSLQTAGEGTVHPDGRMYTNAIIEKHGAEEIILPEGDNDVPVRTTPNKHNDYDTGTGQYL